MKVETTKEAKVKAKSSSGGMRGAIDPHNHTYPHAFVEDLRRGCFGSNAVIEKDKGSEWIIIRGKAVGKNSEIRHKFAPMYYDLELRFKDMARMGVDRHVLSVRPELMFYGLEAEANKEFAASMNDGLSAMARQYPEKFSCMATVPLQDPSAAADELARAKKAGHIGVMINSNVAGMNLNDRSLDVFWAKTSELDLPVFIHPSNVCGQADRLKEFHLRNLIGNPLDTSIAVASLIFGGVLDRYPKLCFYLSHMGGYVPWIRGRWQHGYSVREEPKVHGAKDPEQYIGKFYYDTIIHNPDCFEFAVKTLGVDRIIYGTDYPADMANHQPAREIPGMKRLSKVDQEKILSGNVKKLYGL
jgi:aminocarboxymuconate-semialdehyde decarboxylase